MVSRTTTSVPFTSPTTYARSLPGLRCSCRGPVPGGIAETDSGSSLPLSASSYERISSVPRSTTLTSRSRTTAMWTCAASWRSACGPLPSCRTRSVCFSIRPLSDSANTDRLPLE
jgi:hypothetical protein